MTPSPWPPSPLKKTASTPLWPGARPSAQGMSPATTASSAPMPTVARAGVSSRDANRPLRTGLPMHPFVEALAVQAWIVHRQEYHPDTAGVRDVIRRHRRSR